MNKLREYRKNIAFETIKWCDDNKSNFKHLTARKCNEDEIPSYEEKKDNEFNTVIEIVNMDTLDATMHYQKLDNEQYCFLDMASSNPKYFGGGYLSGALAQEEDICRRTNIHSAFKMMKPPVPKFGACMINNLYIIRNNENKNYEWLSEVVTSSCIMSCALRKPSLYRNGNFSKTDYDITVKKIKK